MNRNITIILAAVAMAATITSARTVRRTLSIFEPAVPETETIADARMEFVYNYTWLHDTTRTLDDDATTSDRMLLQIAPDGLSKFSSYTNLAVDSLIISSTREQIVNAAIDGKLKAGEFMTIYKNYPNAGSLTHTEKICRDWFRYEEPMPDFHWELTDSVVTILGYECRGAQCDFRGRHWTAFYCEDIPVMEGPWKLCGLPGLIMLAEADGGEYTFECVGINSHANRPLTTYKVPFNKTTRHQYYDTKNRYDINPYAYYEATGGGHVTVTDENGNPTPDAYDPNELTFDYIERDWKR